MVASSKLRGQVSKKLDGKDVVILTLEQARNVNRTIDSLENESVMKSTSIKILSDSISKLSLSNAHKDIVNQRLIDSVSIKHINLRDSVFLLNEYRWKYHKNIEIYEKYEKKTNNEIYLHRATSVAFFFISFFLFNQIK
jgi:hypothetical protein